ncbi:MAG: protein-S-isoprenylcysteine O-methyltransferase [Pseudomonadota bacterium]
MIAASIPYLIMAATLGLALWRDAPYATIPFLVLMTAWYTTRLVLTSYDAANVREERDRGRERLLAGLVGVGMIFAPILVLATPLLDFAAYVPLPGQVTVGFALGLVGVYVFWRSHADLGANWSAHLELQKSQTLITHGIYARMRHPMYTAIFLITASQALMLSNWIAGPVGLVTFTLLYVTRIEAEEKMMRDAFAGAYEEYAARVPRLLPRLRSG